MVVCSNVFIGCCDSCFLSNAIPALAKKIDIIEQLLQAMAKAAKSYPQGKMLLFAYTNSNSIVALSKASYLTALNTAQQQ
ncbi:hypothetical protein [Bartonella sp. MR30HLJHH]|uniref:hypothetical protein n=1 Tax=Bartonella sp. MR30HLJHH TaxID=3243557 RepID=UPI0035CEB948